MLALDAIACLFLFAGAIVCLPSSLSSDTLALRLARSLTFCAL